jgi:hypothetical protein
MVDERAQQRKAWTRRRLLQTAGLTAVVVAADSVLGDFGGCATEAARGGTHPAAPVE